MFISKARLCQSNPIMMFISKCYQTLKYNLLQPSTNQIIKKIASNNHPKILGAPMFPSIRSNFNKNIIDANNYKNNETDEVRKCRNQVMSLHLFLLNN